MLAAIPCHRKMIETDNTSESSCNFSFGSGREDVAHDFGLAMDGGVDVVVVKGFVDHEEVTTGAAAGFGCR